MFDPPHAPPPRAGRRRREDDSEPGALTVADLVARNRAGRPTAPRSPEQPGTYDTRGTDTRGTDSRGADSRGAGSDRQAYAAPPDRDPYRDSYRGVPIPPAVPPRPAYPAEPPHRPAYRNGYPEQPPPRPGLPTESYLDPGYLSGRGGQRPDPRGQGWPSPSALTPSGPAALLDARPRVAPPVAGPAAPEVTARPAEAAPPRRLGLSTKPDTAEQPAIREPARPARPAEVDAAYDDRKDAYDGDYQDDYEDDYEYDEEPAAERSRSRELTRSAGVGTRTAPRKRRPALRIAIALVITLCVVVGYYVGLLVYVDQSVDRADVLATTAPEILRPAAQTGAANYLIVLADSEAEGGPRAEFTVLAHLSADRSRVVLLTFPDNALVDLPGCEDRAGAVGQPHAGTLASAYQAAGPNCTIRTLQGMTGIRVDHYVQIDLAGFADMVDSLGGVPVCLGSPLSDPNVGLSIPEGKTMLDGAEAANYAKAISGGEGIDPGRTSRQLDFLAKIFDSALGGSTLLNPFTLTSFLGATSDALTLDPETSFGELKTLADMVKDTEAANLSLVSPPVSRMDYTPAGSETSYVVFDATGSRHLFDAIIDEQPLPSTEEPPPVEGSGQPDAQNGAAAPPVAPTGEPAMPTTC